MDSNEQISILLSPLVLFKRRYELLSLMKKNIPNVFAAIILLPFVLTKLHDEYEK